MIILVHSAATIETRSQTCCYRCYFLIVINIVIVSVLATSEDGLLSDCS